MENIDDVPVSTRGLLDLASQGEAGHGDDVERETDEWFGVIKPLEEDASRCHGDLQDSIL